MKGKLYLVGTPIGNLGDLSHRAKEILSNVDYIACEDSRRSSILLNFYEIKKPLITYHKFKEKESTEKILSLLSMNKSVALISDAGMPCISDPGAVLINAARGADCAIESVPGPTALTTAFSLSGTEYNEFIFLGFLPEKEIRKKRIINEFKDASIPIIIYCGPHDFAKMVSFLYEELGDRALIIARELTKMFEEVLFSKLSDASSLALRGEMVLIILPHEKVISHEEIEEAILLELEKGFFRSEVVKNVANDLDVPKNLVYEIANEIYSRE